ncbi:Tetratricopeptide repeat-containing protein [Gracilibacillus ureilyticus]|uniref:Tetratricopeptide repeat-containing protein n=1 Tax=Gracilibacillus ureilyticus TaxID=531814 RepID=A0A1H9UHJ1_9BACI|nr:tetratricopeptide repeat protein [Gracilibacillus ureilyticus]SES08533.1 Tetratricopeptide repeat-containing protein [Gracilibacillus ureilyticus]
MENEKESRWLSFLSQPSHTFEIWREKQITVLQLLSLSMGLGFINLLNRFYIAEMGEHFSVSALIILAMIFSPLVGFIAIKVGAFFAEKIGRLFKGKATYRQMEIAVGWSLLPLMLLIPFWIVEIILFPDIFTSELFVSMTEKEALLFNIVLFFEVILFGWSLLIFVIGFCKYHEFYKMKPVVYVVHTMAFIFLLYNWGNGAVQIYDTVQYNKAIEEEDYETILTNAETDLEEEPADLTALNNKAYALINEGNYEEGLEVVNEVLEIEPDNDTALNNKGWALNMLGRNEEALTVIMQAIAIEPNEAYEYINLGNIYYGLGNYQSGIDAYETAIDYDISEDTASAYYGLGITYYDLAEYEKTIDYMERYLTYLPEDIDAYWVMANAYDFLNNQTQALEMLDHILAIDPENVAVHTYKADLHLYYEQIQEAEIMYQKIITDYPEYPDGYYGMAAIAAYNQNTIDAITNLEIVLEYDPYYFENALYDVFFDNIRETSEFQALEAKYYETDGLYEDSGLGDESVRYD